MPKQTFVFAINVILSISRTFLIDFPGNTSPEIRTAPTAYRLSPSNLTSRYSASLIYQKMLQT